MDYSASRAELKQHFEHLLKQAARDLKGRVAKGELTREQAEAEYDAIRLRIAEDYKASTTRLDSSPPPAVSSSPVSEPTKAQGLVDRPVPGRAVLIASESDRHGSSPLFRPLPIILAIVFCGLIVVGTVVIVSQNRNAWEHFVSADNDDTDDPEAARFHELSARSQTEHDNSLGSATQAESQPPGQGVPTPLPTPDPITGPRIKGVAIGMNLQEAANNLASHLSSDKWKVETIQDTDGTDRVFVVDHSNVCRDLESWVGLGATSIAADSDGKVVGFLLDGCVSRDLFQSGGMSHREFAEACSEAYGLPNLRLDHIEKRGPLGGAATLIPVYRGTSPDGWEILISGEAPPLPGGQIGHQGHAIVVRRAVREADRKFD